jgi:hypothetical protein
MTGQHHSNPKTLHSALLNWSSDAMAVFTVLQYPLGAVPVPGQPGKVTYEYNGNPMAEQVTFIERQQWPLPEGVSLQDPDFATAIHTGKHSRIRL